MAESGVRLSDLLVSLSLATDLGFGQPPEHMVRAARISMRIGDRLGLDPAQLATLYDVSILTYVGCPVYGNEASALFGDDIDFRAHALEIDLAGFPAMVFMLRRAGYGTSVFNRARRATSLMATGGRGMVEQMANHCSAAGALADRLGLGADVKAGIEQSYARWDGKGVPSNLAKDALSLSARISHVAEACEVFERTSGIDGAVDVVGARSGTHFDPTVAAAVLTDPVPLFDGIDEHCIDALLDAAPRERPEMTDEELDVALEAVGDFCDLRCPYFAGHARGTADLVAVASTDVLGLSTEESRLAYRAALVHDVGRFGIPGALWDKPGPLSSSEWERVRLHVYYVERIFDRPAALRDVARLAATHHERLDGSGYHHGVAGPSLSMAARVLAAADAYHAMTQHRPHRRALAEDDLLAELRADVDSGRLDGDATEAVLAAAGHVAASPADDRPRPAVRRGGPGGHAIPGNLSERECEVLVFLTQGLPYKGIARELGISPKTVGAHLEHIYTKLDVTNRAGAAMFAMQHGLLGRLPSVEGGTGVVNAR